MPTENYTFKLPVSDNGGTLPWPARDSTYVRVVAIDCTDWLNVLNDSIASVNFAGTTACTINSVSETATSFSFTQSGGGNNVTIPLTFSLALSSGVQKAVFIELPIAGAVGAGFLSGHAAHGSLTANAGAQAVSDVQNAPFTGEVPMTIGQNYAARRSLKVMCTVAGDITVTYTNGSTGVWPVTVGTQTLPLAVTMINSATATATFANLI